MKKLPVICGPTATGKTDLALYLSKKFQGEIISADSRQVYRGMDIITGKDLPVSAKLQITNDKLQIKDKHFTVGYRLKDQIPIWLVDIVTPDYLFNVGEYTKLAKGVIEDIRSRQKLPIIVGGTGLYIKSLIEPLSFVTIPRNVQLRNQLEKLDKNTLAEFLKKENPEKWEMMNQSDRGNPRRLIRAIEITQYVQKYNISMYRNIDKQANTLLIGLYAPLSQLYKQIDRRVDERMLSGAEKEVKRLVSEGFTWSHSVLGVTIGYKEWQDYFANKITKEEVSQKWKYAEHAYARRQMTWFKKQKSIHWFDITHPTYKEKIEQLVTKWYTARSDTRKSRNII